MQSVGEEENLDPVLHVIIVGFHHKKGAVVEYSHPPLPENLPESWKQLPSLAIPDGSHRYEWDTIYFHLPSLEGSQRTVFGVACYRQIRARDVKNPSGEITRSSVQKAVCVLSTLPLYGHIRVHVWQVAEHYMKQGDLENREELPRLFRNLNAGLKTEMMGSPSELYLGLSARQLLSTFGTRTLLLFKLLFLEKKVLFVHSPVQVLCCGILSLLSLVPRMLQDGLYEAVALPNTRHLSRDTLSTGNFLCGDFNGVLKPGESSSALVDSTWEATEGLLKEIERELSESSIGKMKTSTSQSSLSSRTESTSSKLGNFRTRVTELVNWPSQDPEEAKEDKKMSSSLDSLSEELKGFDFHAAGFPLAIFSKGVLCHPYLSLPFVDFLSDINVRGFWIGATNALFRHKKDLVDVMVEFEGGQIEILSPELRKQLTLTTEDLRFVDVLLKGAMEREASGEVEEWIRSRFWLYTVSMLRTSLQWEIASGDEASCREIDCFNFSFMTALRETHHYKMWSASSLEKSGAIMSVEPCHPCSGQSLSVQDIRMRISHVVQGTERGKRLNQTLQVTGKAVGKAVGGAWAQARGQLSSWWGGSSPMGAAPAAEVVADDDVRRKKHARTGSDQKPLSTTS